MHMHLTRIKSNKSILFFFNTYTRIKSIKFTRINSKFIFILPHRMCVCMCVYVCMCVCVHILTPLPAPICRQKMEVRYV